MSQLPADCLNEIFEYLEEDKTTLYSCLLVNRLWCEVSVRILWRSVWKFSTQACSTLACSTLFACLSNESKDILHDNGIIIKTPTSKTPIFNYPAFCKVLSIYHIDDMIERFLDENQRSISSQNSYIVKQEIYKMFMNQTSLKKLNFYWSISMQKVVFISYPGAEGCLKNLSELYCNSAIYSEFFYQLSKTCHTLQSLDIKFRRVISDGITDLITVQKDLKYLGILQHYDCESLKDIIPSLTNLPNTLIKLNLYGGDHCIPLLFIAKLINLQELKLSFENQSCFGDFEKLTFSQLQILRITYACPRYELLVKFLENNGKNLKECYLEGCDDPLNLAIAKFCSNLRKLSTGFKINELETLKMVFNNCQYLKSIKIWCGGDYLSEREALDAIMKYSHENICEIILFHIYNVRSRLLPEELESFFINWSNHVPQRQKLSLIIVNDDELSLDAYDDNMKIIEKYIKLGIIKKFKAVDFDTEF